MTIPSRDLTLRFENHWLSIIKTQEEDFDYTCGAPLWPEGHKYEKTLIIRPNLLCSTPVELTYYKPKPLGVGSMCCHCGSHDGVVEAALLVRYQTVLPMCQECQDAGKASECSRPKVTK